VTCPACVKQSGLYLLTCAACVRRLLMSAPKEAREAMKAHVARTHPDMIAAARKLNETSGKG
jgi:hypothetical protein